MTLPLHIDYSLWPLAAIEQDFRKYAMIISVCTAINRTHAAGIDLTYMQARFAAVEAEYHQRLTTSTYAMTEQPDGTTIIKI